MKFMTLMINNNMLELDMKLISLLKLAIYISKSLVCRMTYRKSKITALCNSNNLGFSRLVSLSIFIEKNIILTSILCSKCTYINSFCLMME
jgi:hypothetical protein